jgi:formylmethanofuran dehydrogenase subunit B
MRGENVKSACREIVEGALEVEGLLRNQLEACRMNSQKMEGVIRNFDTINVLWKHDGTFHIHWWTEADYRAAHIRILETSKTLIIYM